MVQGAKRFGLFGSVPEPADGGDGGPDPGKPPVNKPKPTKKVAGFKKQCGSKITMIGSKLTELKVLKNKVEGAALLLGICFVELYVKQHQKDIPIVLAVYCSMDGNIYNIYAYHQHIHLNNYINYPKYAAYHLLI